MNRIIQKKLSYKRSSKIKTFFLRVVGYFEAVEGLENERRIRLGSPPYPPSRKAQPPPTTISPLSNWITDRFAS